MVIGYWLWSLVMVIVVMIILVVTVDTMTITLTIMKKALGAQQKNDMKNACEQAMTMTRMTTTQ